MAHPYQSSRADKVSKSRVKDHLKGYASGGGVHADVKEDKSLVRKMVKPSALKMDGGAAKTRMDRPGRAAGGRVKKTPQTNIHINVAPPPPQPAAGVGVPPGVPVPKMAPPPMPPGPPPGLGGPGPGPGMPPPGGMPGMPPGMPPMPRAKGGRVDATSVKTPVQHMPNTMPFKKRGKPVTYATGGQVEGTQSSGNATMRQTVGPHATESEAKAFRGRKTGGATEAPKKGGMAPHMPGGGRGGLARLAKAHRAAKKH